MPERVSGGSGHVAIADVVRLVAILSVVAHHIAQYSLHRTLGTFAHWGVAAFFVLSGYLLSGPYLRAILDDAPWPSARRFLIRRALRILPLYEVAVVASVVVLAILVTTPLGRTGFLAIQLGHGPWDLRDIAAHALLLQDFSLATAVTINGPLWTMPVDFEFYLALPFLARATQFAMRSIPRRRREGALAILLAIGIAGSTAYRFAVAGTVMRLVSHDFAVIYVVIDNGIGMGSAFLLGIGLALVLRVTARRGRRPGPAVALVAAGALFALLWRLSDDATVVEWGIEVVVAALSAALAVYGLSAMPRAVRFAQGRAIVTGATLAYAIYLFHYPFLETVVVGLRLGRGVATFAILVGAVGVLLVPFAYVLHRTIERPFLILKDRQR